MSTPMTPKYLAVAALLVITAIFLYQSVQISTISNSQQAAVSSATTSLFKLGDKVIAATTPTYVQKTLKSGNVAGTQNAGAPGTITSNAQSSNGSLWYKVDFDTGVDGYVAEKSLKALDMPPTLSITSPVGGIHVTGQSIMFEVDAKDDKGIAKVELYVNGVLKATLTQAPFRTLISLLPSATPYKFSALATDTTGQDTFIDPLVYVDSATVINGIFHAIFAGVPGSYYDIQRKADIIGSWTTAQAGVQANIADGTIPYDEPVSGSAAYFRIVPGAAPTSCSGTPMNAPWAKGFTSTASLTGGAVAVDPTNGNLVAAFNLNGAANFGCGQQTSASTLDMVLGAYTGTGVPLWTKRFGNGYVVSPQKASIDQSGNIYIAGTFRSTLNLGSVSLVSAGDSDVFIAKFSPTNHDQPLWAKSFGSSGADSIGNMTVDAFGNVVFGGYIPTAAWPTGISFGGDTFYNASLYLAKLDSNGAHVWSKSYATGAGPQMSGIATDSSGNVFVTGKFQGDINFGSDNTTNLTSPGIGSDVFVAKLAASTGNHIWSKRFGTDYGDSGTSVAMDSSGNPILTGSMYTTINFGGATLSGSNLRSVYLAKLSGSDGSHIWSATALDGNYVNQSGLAVDASGNIIVSAGFPNSVKVKGTTAASADFNSVTSQSSVVAKYSSTGGLLWAKMLGGNYRGFDHTEVVGVTDLKVDREGRPVSVGILQGPMISDGTTLLTSTSNTMYDTFILKLNP